MCLGEVIKKIPMKKVIKESNPELNPDPSVRGADPDLHQNARIPNTSCTVYMRCIDSPTCRTLVTAPWSSSLSPWQKGEFWYSRAFAVFPQGELYIRISRSSLQRRPDKDIFVVLRISQCCGSGSILITFF
jgi:hypothetical protein